MDRTTDPTWERWEEVDRLFAAALERPDTEREEFVALATPGDPDLRQAVLRLLEAEAESVGLFEGPDGATSRAALEELSALEGDDRRVGSFRLVRRIGRGGMGSVYLAERVGADFEQRVAIKVLRRGLDTEDIVSRFLSERRILAGLSHPNIARLLDGGSTPDGRPYLVLDYVDGTQIDRYCSDRKLLIRDRLALFLRVADAVRYAHAKLVVHRDLKPSNVLVTADGVVKLLDFGIAKLLGPDDDGLTRTGLRLLTPDYASPEQVRGEPVTTASDVYQLGALLFLMLTGSRPFDRPAGAPSHGAPDRVVRRPSEAVSEPRLQRALRGDLDTIVLKALREEPERRYPSVIELAEDVRAHLEGRPVSARADTLAYRTGKLLRRRPWLAPASLAAVVLLASYGLLSARHTTALEAERNEAREQAARAEEVQEFLVDLFRSADPYAPADPDRGRAITVVEALGLGAERASQELGNRPRIQASLLDAIAQVYENLGLPSEGLSVAETALALHRETGPGTAAYRDALGRLARINGWLARTDTALALYRRRLEETLADPAATSDEILTAYTDLGLHLNGPLGRPREARDAMLEALAAVDSSTTPHRRAGTHQSLSSVYNTLTKDSAAVYHAREALRLRRETAGEDAASTGIAHVTLAAALGSLRQWEEATRHFERGIAILEKRLGPDHEFTLSALNNLAVLNHSAGDLAGAERSHRRLIAGRLAGGGGARRTLGDAYQNLATVVAAQGRLQEAAGIHRRALEVYRETLDPGHFRLAMPRLSLAGIALQLERPGEAERHLRPALEILEDVLPPDHYVTAVARCRLGRAYVALRGDRMAEPLLRKAAAILDSTTHVPAYRAECLEALADLYERTGRPDAAARVLDPSGGDAGPGGAPDGERARPAVAAPDSPPA